MTKDEYLTAELARVTGEITEAEPRLRKLYQERLALYRTAAQYGWTQRRMAEVCDTTVGAIQQVLHKARRREGSGGPSKHRVANGSCPVCGRTFQDVPRHLRKQHPTYKRGARA